MVMWAEAPVLSGEAAEMGFLQPGAFSQGVFQADGVRLFPVVCGRSQGTLS